MKVSFWPMKIEGPPSYLLLAVLSQSIISQITLNPTKAKFCLHGQISGLKLLQAFLVRKIKSGSNRFHHCRGSRVVGVRGGGVGGG